MKEILLLWFSPEKICHFAMIWLLFSGDVLEVIILLSSLSDTIPLAILILC